MDQKIELIELIVRLLQTMPHFVVLLLMIAAAWYVLRSFRANLAKTELRPIDYLESFQKMREEGKLTEEEFRIIRKLVSLQISRSLDESKTDYSLLNR